MNTKLRKLVIPGVLVAGVGAGVTLADVMKDPIPNAGAQQAAGATATPLAAPDPSAAGLSTAFRSASRAALGAVVQVRVETAARTVSQQIPPQLRGTPFEDMFGGGQMRIPPQQGSGSGFILSQDGYVVTNNHVVADASHVKVVLNDKREYDARVVGRDPNTDIAVIKIDTRGLPTARLGDSDQLETGDWVLALGYPLQLGQTTTAGIVSAKGRSIGIMDRSSGASNPLEHYIQTDAAINPGNSGGPLVDLQGRVVGVNSAIASPTGYYSGYGFAVPINVAKRVADDLVRYGVVHRPMMGVEIRDVTTADAEVFKLPAPDGALVAGEPRDGARAAGLEMGDVIVGIDGRAVASAGDVMEMVMRKAPGESVKVDYIRYGERRSATLRLGEMARQAAARTGGDSDAADDGDGVADRVGFRAQAMTPDIAAQLKSTRADGVVVSAVDPQGPAAGYLAPGLVIERFNGRAIASEADLRAAVGTVRAGQVVSITARRPDGSRMLVNFRARG